MHRTTAFIAALAAGAAAAQPTADPDPVNKFAWGENVGWINFGDSPSPDNFLGRQIIDGASPSTFLQGFAWGENIGWINLGNGNGPYANNDNTDFGVNIGAGGVLSGFAWGENVGWINFDTSQDAQRVNMGQNARYDFGAGRFRGYAWGENIGWINLDSNEAGKFVSLDRSPCLADLAAPLGINSQTDTSAFVTAFFNNDLDNIDYAAPFGVISQTDVQGFVDAFFEGCP
ncbi:MAG: hypothetical protein AAFR38_11075 [Planctomycetota bacterium]